MWYNLVNRIIKVDEMADTLQNIKLPANEWVDLYAESGIAVGTQILTENLTQTPAKLYAGATAPIDNLSFSRLMQYEEKINDVGDTGAWAKSEVVDGLVNVKVYAL